jgi:hypothetical protein
MRLLFCSSTTLLFLAACGGNVVLDAAAGGTGGTGGSLGTGGVTTTGSGGQGGEHLPLCGCIGPLLAEDGKGGDIQVACDAGSCMTYVP